MVFAGRSPSPRAQHSNSAGNSSSTSATSNCNNNKPGLVVTDTSLGVGAARKSANKSYGMYHCILTYTAEFIVAENNVNV